MQKWPWSSFAKLRHVLTTKAGCDYQLMFSAGASLDLEGNPTPPVHGFVRVVDGDLRLATVVAWDDDDYIGNSELQAVCDALELDLDHLFGNHH